MIGEYLSIFGVNLIAPHCKPIPMYHHLTSCDILISYLHIISLSEFGKEITKFLPKTVAITLYDRYILLPCFNKAIYFPCQDHQSLLFPAVVCCPTSPFGRHVGKPVPPLSVLKHAPHCYSPTHTIL